MNEQVSVATVTQSVWDAMIAECDRMRVQRNHYVRAEADANYRHGLTINELEALKLKAAALRACVAKVERFLFVGGEFAFAHCVIKPLIDELDLALGACDEAGAL